jgi:triosephosphate isomerase
MRARIPIIVGNWKMHNTIGESSRLAQALRERLDYLKGIEIGVCPPYLSIPVVAEVLKGSCIKWGAQDMHWEPRGAYTGEISSNMLLDIGCTYVILGHSERRHLLGETDEVIRRKLEAALRSGLTPILCVGELLEERDKGITMQVVQAQLIHAIKGLSPGMVRRLIIAYEPVWAIGTGRNATPQQAQEVQGFIRSLITEQVGQEIAEAVRVQYGGSVKPENIGGFMEQPDIDGALVGGASLDQDSFSQIVKIAVPSSL